jgi:hypothetical protein
MLKETHQLRKKKLCYEKLPKFEQHFELVSRIVKLNLLFFTLVPGDQEGLFKLSL